MKTTYNRDATIFGTQTADSINSIFELFVKLNGGKSDDATEPALMGLSYFANDHFDELEYIRGLSKSADDRLGLSPPVWLIGFKYKIVYGDHPWDIEASYRTFKKNGRPKGSQLGRFYLRDIYVIDNSGKPNHAQDAFLKVAERLKDIQADPDRGVAKPKDDTESWSAAMLAKDYMRGPQFSLYEDLVAWELTNSRPHVRGQNKHGYQIYYTDQVR
ncbi:hypothetical protein O4H61_01230 [Roseovarius aestuarii]|nr:hypothetical protein [Roseovarius aestuarii]